MAEGSIVTRTAADGIRILEMRNPPVTTLTHPLRESLHGALIEADLDPDVRAVVLIGGRTFSAGADLAEFDSGDALRAPTLHGDIAGLLDSALIPSVAAISGVALGGGLELALACTARIAGPASRLGLPETTLGFMPGAGGTQRLPRLIGIEHALDLVVSGRLIDAATAAEWHLLDALAASNDDLVDEAVALAASLADRQAAEGTRRRARDLAVTEPLAAAFVDGARRDARRRRRSTGVQSALEALDAAVSLPFDEGMDREIALFTRLASSPEAAAARYRFLSDRAGGKPSGEVVMPDTVAVIGAGTMGRGIARAFLDAGFAVTLVDVDEPAVAAGRAAILSALDSAVEKGRLDREAADERAASLSTGTGLESAAGAGLVVEAVFESMAVKIDVFRALDSLADADAVLASNTSSLDLDQLAEATADPSRVVGMHFFSPAEVMPLVEVVRGGLTSRGTLDLALAVSRRLRKTPVVSAVAPGFIGNRIFDQYLRQAHLLLQQGCSPAQVDAALVSWGMAMGPFSVLDLVGNDVPWRARQERGDGDPAWRIADDLCERGWFGRKTGRGWYDYASRPPAPNPDLELPAGPGASDDEIVLRCVLAMVNEAAAVVDEHVAGSTRDVDTVMVLGYGFPRERGGPWFFAEHLGWPRLVSTMRRWREETGDASWDPHPALLALGGLEPTRPATLDTVGAR